MSAQHNSPRLTLPVCIVLLSAACWNLSQANAEPSGSLTFSKPALYQTALPYIAYFKEKALKEGSEFPGLTKSFQLYLDENPSSIVTCGASCYDQTILGRICLYDNPPNTAILDTYISYFKKLADPDNPLFNTNGDYCDGSNQPLCYGPYATIRLTERTTQGWSKKWDWRVDTGAAATLIIYALDAQQKIQDDTKGYKELAITLAEYILKLQDSDGGLRYGPRGMWHESNSGSVDFYWNLKSTEQNERALYALEALYQVTGDSRYNQAAGRIRDWLKGLYDFSAHLYASAAIFNQNTLKWEKAKFDYIATDVMALAPLTMMFNDPYFGATQDQRDKEVEDMFAAIEKTAAFLDTENNPVLFRFCNGQEGSYGTVEWSAQMALAYLQAAQNYAQRNDEPEKTQQYLQKYTTLVTALEKHFTVPADAPQSKIAPYASYPDGKVAGNVSTGTGFDTPNCQAALASAYFAFAKAGFEPVKLNGGLGIPQLSAEEPPDNTTDTTPPGTPAVTDEGKTTSNRTKLSASWTSEDKESGIAEYHYQILQYSPIELIVVKDWTAAGTNSSVTAEGLNLEENHAYFWGVKARNNAGLWSETGYSDGITVTSAAQNSPPELSLIGSKKVDAGTLLQFTVTANDPDNDPLTYSTGPLPAGAVFNPQTAAFSWTPSVEQAGTHTARFEVKDAELSDAEDITITVKTVTPPPQNNAPAANGQTVSTGYNTPLEITLTATDQDNDPLVYSIVTAPAYGTLTEAFPKVTYTPKDNYHGQDSFTFKTNDGKADSNIAAVNITINAPVIKNTPPKLKKINDVYRAKAGQWLVIPIIGTDSDGDKLSLKINGAPQDAYFCVFNTEYKEDDSSYIKALFCWKPQLSKVRTHKLILTLSDAEVSDIKTIKIRVEYPYCPRCLWFWRKWRSSFFPGLINSHNIKRLSIK